MSLKDVHALPLPVAEGCADRIRRAGDGALHLLQREEPDEAKR
jgi:hypothetical protein